MGEIPDKRDSGEESIKTSRRGDAARRAVRPNLDGPKAAPGADRSNDKRSLRKTETAEKPKAITAGDAARRAVCPELNDHRAIGHSTSDRAGTDPREGNQRKTVVEKIVATIGENREAKGEAVKRQRLIALFESVPTSSARSLYERLNKGEKGDEFAKYFARKLPAETRAEMLRVLQDKFESPHEAHDAAGAKLDPGTRNTAFGGLNFLRTHVSSAVFYNFLAQNERSVLPLLKPYGYEGSGGPVDVVIGNFDKAYSAWRRESDHAGINPAGDQKEQRRFRFSEPSAPALLALFTALAVVDGMRPENDSDHPAVVAYHQLTGYRSLHTQFAAGGLSAALAAGQIAIGAVREGLTRIGVPTDATDRLVRETIPQVAEELHTDPKALERVLLDDNPIVKYSPILHALKDSSVGMKAREESKTNVEPTGPAGEGETKLFEWTSKRQDSKGARYWIDGDELKFKASQHGYHVYEYLDQNGKLLYVGKSGGAHGVRPISWTQRLQSEHINTGWIGDARRVRVTYGLTEQQMWALEDVLIPTARENIARGVYDSKFPQGSVSHNAADTLKESTAVFAIDCYPVRVSR